MDQAPSTFRPESLARKVFVWTLLYAVIFAGASISVILQR